MTTPSLATPISSRWPLNRLLLLVLLGGYLTLLADIRVEHADRFARFWQAWIPIYYAGAMALACLLGALAWTPAMRRLLFWLFSVGFAVAGYGLYLHNHGDFLKLSHTLLDAWIAKIKHQDVPPELAPAAFAGLALIGMLTCARRTQPR